MAAEPLLKAWENFYVIVGSSAGALTGLQFVVMALNSEARAMPRSESGVLAFGTPTVVHFCGVLLIAAALSAPWPSVVAVALAVRICGIAGIGYMLVVIRRASRQRDYEPVAEDWIWHVAFPVIGYAAVIAGSLALEAQPTTALFVIAGAVLLLIFTGIHNAWDAAVYIAIGGSAAQRDGSLQGPGAG